MSYAKSRALGISGSVLAFAIFCSQPAFANDAIPTAQSTPPAKCEGNDGYSASFDGRRTFLWRPGWLKAIKAGATDNNLLSEQIIEQGEASLGKGPYSVTDKPKLIPGATANHYTSIGPYWWPGKSKNGLPYIRRDGEVNPERNGPEFDKARLRNLAADMRALAIAYYVSEDERFANHAARLARSWFVDPDTRMLPNFDFAQGIPGKVNGRGEGIIEAIDLATIGEALGLLRPSPAFSAEDHQAIEAWYRDFALWMATSENGTFEMQKTNNHGVFYDYLLATFALQGRVEGAVGNLADAFPRYRIGVQMDRRGRFLEELKRTRSWHYSHFVVEGAARFATIAECADRDLWRYELPDGRGLGKAREFLASYRYRIDEWPFRDSDLAAGKIDQARKKNDEIELLFSASNIESFDAETILKLLP